MLKSAFFMTVGAVLFAMVGSAVALVGIAPQKYGDEALINQQWLYGLSGGENFTSVYGITAAGSNHAGATQLTAGHLLQEIDTTAASTGVALPTCSAGTRMSVFNHGANTLTVYPSIADNPLTQAQDTINGTTDVTETTETVQTYSCAKNGVWSAQ